VIDNDQTRSDEALVSELSETFPSTLYYHCEGKRGIPCARNRAVEEIHRLSSDYLVFIDDDEWVEPHWSDTLYSYCQEQGGDVVVSGNVSFDLPGKSPEHIQRILTENNNLLVPG